MKLIYSITDLFQNSRTIKQIWDPVINSWTPFHKDNYKCQKAKFPSTTKLTSHNQKVIYKPYDMGNWIHLKEKRGETTSLQGVSPESRINNQTDTIPSHCHKYRLLSSPLEIPTISGSWNMKEQNKTMNITRESPQAVINHGSINYMYLCPGAVFQVHFFPISGSQWGWGWFTRR